MTTAAESPAAPPPNLLPEHPRSNLLTLALATILVYLAPRLAGRLWARAPRWQYLTLGSINLAILFTFALHLTNLITLPGVPLRIPPALFESSPSSVLSGPLLTLAALVLTFILLPTMAYFIILPFAARPGSNRTTAWHVVRTTVLGTYAVYPCTAALFAFHHAWLRFADTQRPPLNFYEFLLGYFVAGTILILLAFLTLFRAAGVEYRRAADLPKPQDLLCDACGYDLRMTPHNANCPECGKPVASIIGPNARIPSAWERHPNPLRLHTVLRQIATLIVAPMRLFETLPITTGHTAARRWLKMMLTLVGALAFWIVGGLHLVAPDFIVGPDNPRFYLAGAAFGAIWALLAAMMVGIETAGVATVAWWRSRTLDLASASKVTSYASTLLLFWVLIGGTQIVAIAWYANTDWPKRVGPRYDEIISVGTLAAAHILGLLWFEITVYRGLRKIQWANK